MHCNCKNYKQWKMFLNIPLQYTSQNQEQIESICKKLINLFSGMIKQQPTCSTLVGDFIAKLSTWCPNDKDKKSGQDIPLH